MTKEEFQNLKKGDKLIGKARLINDYNEGDYVEFILTIGRGYSEGHVIIDSFIYNYSMVENYKIASKIKRKIG